MSRWGIFIGPIKISLAPRNPADSFPFPPSTSRARSAPRVSGFYFGLVRPYALSIGFTTILNKLKRSFAFMHFDAVFCPQLNAMARYGLITINTQHYYNH